MANSKRPSQVNPPALPQAPFEYVRTYQDQLNNVLRLYFNNIEGNLRALLSTDSGGAALFNPYGMFYSTATQTANATDTDQNIQFQEAFGLQGVALNGVNDDEIIITYQGMYNFQVTLQTFSTNANTKDITLYIKKNGVSIPYSAQKKTVVKSGFDQITYNFNVACSADDILTFVFRVSATTLRLESSAPTAGLPGVPSATIAVKFVSNVGM